MTTAVGEVVPNKVDEQGLKEVLTHEKVDFLTKKVEDVVNELLKGGFSIKDI